MKDEKDTSTSDKDRPLPADTARERHAAAPTNEDMNDPKEVWKDGERVPATQRDRRTDGGERVADAGDVGGGTPTPYSTETAADAVARQTQRDDREEDGPQEKDRRR